MRTAVFLLASTSAFVGLALWLATSRSDQSGRRFAPARSSLGTRIGALAFGRPLPLALPGEKAGRRRTWPAKHKASRHPAARESGGRAGSRSTLKASYRLVLALLAYGAGLALLTVLAVRWLTRLLESASY